MRPAPPHEEELFTHPTEISGTVFVNDRVCVHTEDQRVISVHGVVFSHYSIKDRAAEAYTMVLLFESGYADQERYRTLLRHRSRVLEALCEELNKTNTLFPCTHLRMRYSVAPSHPEVKSGHVSDVRSSEVAHSQ
jgi:hypothetical protein